MLRLVTLQAEKPGLAPWEEPLHSNGVGTGSGRLGPLATCLWQRRVQTRVSGPPCLVPRERASVSAPRCFLAPLGYVSVLGSGEAMCLSKSFPTSEVAAVPGLETEKWPFQSVGGGGMAFMPGQLAERRGSQRAELRAGHPETPNPRSRPFRSGLPVASLVPLPQALQGKCGAGAHRGPRKAGAEEQASAGRARSRRSSLELSSRTVSASVWTRQSKSP